MKLLVTGITGQISMALQAYCLSRPDIELITIGRPQFDLDEPTSVAATIASHIPDIVVSAAAWTAVDLAEDEPDRAMRANGIGAGGVARGAAQVGAPILHLSTDYVFDGTKLGAWSEDDSVDPVSVYGMTKLEGERRVASVNPKHIILRTAWVYSPFGKNFLKTMLGLAKTRDTLSVVDDQYGCPTSAIDIAHTIVGIADQIKSAAEDDERWGVYHLAGTGTATWCDFAREIFSCARNAGLPTAKVMPVSTADFPTKAVRPANSRLDCGKLERVFGLRLPSWYISVRSVVEELSKDRQFLA